LQTGSDSDSDTDDTDETEILFAIKDIDEEICFSSTLSKTKRERQPVKQKEFIDIFTCEKVVEVTTSKQESFSRHEYVAPKIETFIGKISWFDRSKNFGEVASSFEGKVTNIFIPKSAIERSIQQGLLSESKVFFSRDKVKITAYMGKKGFEAQTITC
jgi:cold shock CspA family protein